MPENTDNMSRWMEDLIQGSRNRQMKRLGGPDVHGRNSIPLLGFLAPKEQRNGRHRAVDRRWMDDEGMTEG
jgi:hypothetical protein